MNLWPVDIPVERATWGLRSNTQMFTSPLSGAQQVLELPGAKWVATLEIPPLEPAEIRALLALLVSLRGQANTVDLWDHSQPTPRGVASGAPYASTAATGSTLPTGGWTANQAGILLAGDMIGVNGELKMVVADASSNSGGSCSLQIEPPLRNPATPGGPITVTRPTCPMRLADPNQTSWITEAPKYSKLTLDFVEAIA